MNPIKQNHEAMLRTGAMALAAAGASTAAHAATVQITFQNSFVSSTLGNQLINTDFGGDGFWETNAGARYADAVGVLAVDWCWWDSAGHG